MTGRPYTCKCGRSSQNALFDLAPFPCEACQYCGTTLERTPQHQAPVPHDWQPDPVDTDDGPKTITRCSFCRLKKTDYDRSQGAP